jgi:tetratricopeptide (TPR) repeat protein
MKEFQNDSQALRNLSSLYGDAFPARMDRIIMFAQRSLESSPGDPHSTATLGWAYFKKGDYKRSVEYYKQALSAQPNEPYLLYHTGIASLRAGNQKSGNAYLKELVSKYPDHALSKKAKREGQYE